MNRSNARDQAAPEQEFSQLTLRERDKVHDPKFQTARSKLQEKRGGINSQIDKELRMRQGANNLMRVIRDKKSKQKVALEIDYVDSNLKLLKDELDGVNCSLETYQKVDDAIPMVPLGLKDAEPVDFTVPMKDFILEHYSEVPDKYSVQIAQLNACRERIRHPQRNMEGIADVIRYFNLLNIVDRRFFTADRSSAGISFTWVDAFTGVAFKQRTIVFEKGSVLFNLAALYSQVATAQNRDTLESLRESCRLFSLAAGTLVHLRDNFTNSPSVDMKPEMLDMLISMMKSQAQECAFLDKSMGDASRSRDAVEIIDLIGDACLLSESMSHVRGSITSGEVLRYFDLIPPTWIRLVEVKANYYRGLAYHQLADACMMLANRSNPNLTDIKFFFTELCRITKQPANRGPTGRHSRQSGSQSGLRPPSNPQEVANHGRACLREALHYVEEAISMANLSKHLRDLGPLMTRLRETHNRWLTMLHKTGLTDDLGTGTSSAADRVELSWPAPDIVSLRSPSDSPNDWRQCGAPVQPLLPDWPAYPVPDPFRGLGPLHVFNARTCWTPARSVVMAKDPAIGYGFSIKGDSPVQIVAVDHDSPAERAGLKSGDFIVGVNGVETKWDHHDRVVDLVKRSRVGPGTSDHLQQVTLRVVSPLVASTTASSFSLAGIKVNEQQPSHSMPVRKQPIKERSWRKRLSGSLFGGNKKRSTKREPTPHVADVF